MQDYSGFKWIKVKRHVYDPNLSWEDNYKLLEQHHVDECNFLITKVRELASTLQNHAEAAMEHDEYDGID
jgi:hypothetical protein